MLLGMDQLFHLYPSVLVDLILYTCNYVACSKMKCIILIVFQLTVEVTESVASIGIPH